MKIHELLEAEASDTEIKQRYGDFDPQDRPMLYSKLAGAPAPTLWTCYDAIQNILGKDNVTDDEDQLELNPHMYYVYESSGPAMFRDTGGYGQGGSIEIPNLNSTAAGDVAVAVHEAFHAYVHSKSPGRLTSNEKIINTLSEKWLRKHLSGTALYVALEKIVGSRVNYGQHHLPRSSPSDKR